MGDLDMKFNKYTKNAKASLSDLFLAMEMAFIKNGQAMDAIGIYVNDKNEIIAGLGKVQLEDRGNPYFSEQLMVAMSPYFDLLKKDFSPEVVDKYIKKNNEKNLYIGEYLQLTTKHLFKKVFDDNYLDNVGKSKINKP